MTAASSSRSRRPGCRPCATATCCARRGCCKTLADAPGVNVPEVLVEDAGAPPFFIMSFVPGDSYEPKKDVSEAPPSPEIVRARALACAEMLARLQQAPPPEGEPELPLREELDRWERLYSTVPEELHHGQRELYDRLAAAVPAPVAPTILHGDYRIGNMQFDGERLAAIIDWEIWSLGDPRTDLAWLLTWLDPVQRFYERRIRGRRARRRRAAEPRRDARRLRRRAARHAVVRGLLPLQDGLDDGGADQAEPPPRDAVSAPRGRGHDAPGESSSAA